MVIESARVSLNCGFISESLRSPGSRLEIHSRIVMLTEVPVQASLSVPLRTVFLDREGVINERMPEGQYVRAPAELRVLPGVPNAIARLNRAGVRVLVLSNQRGVALGLYTSSDVDAVHDYLQSELARFAGY